VNQDDFIKGLKIAVRDSAARGVMKQLEKPSGRRPSVAALRRSAWYRTLSESDKATLAEIVHEATESTLFGLLVVLDGGCAIEDGEAQGELLLFYRHHGVDVPLNGDALPPLHELYEPG
jgi:hypothetical protein